MRVTSANLYLPVEPVHGLKIRFLADVASGAAVRDSRDESASGIEEPVMCVGKPPRAITAGHGDLRAGLQLDAGAHIVDVFPSDLIRQAQFVVTSRIELIKCLAASIGGIGVP